MKTIAESEKHPGGIGILPHQVVLVDRVEPRSGKRYFVATRVWLGVRQPWDGSAYGYESFEEAWHHFMVKCGQKGLRPMAEADGQYIIPFPKEG